MQSIRLQLVIENALIYKIKKGYIMYYKKDFHKNRIHWKNKTKL